ncbi:hypothetical protein ILUMI_08257 [Ignelater luminosus]|uniref:Uncharacterized protein n=1 Tax=Ignelater luminosus TaxID=2038154 RepID=A0A8K0D4R9_IGNLU|nr:hypothetical protein ILUMI_08257 [Ignelater luminosus]
MASNNTTPTTPTTPSTPQEQTPLRAETDVAKVESGALEVKETEKTSVDEIKEKIKKPTIGVSLILFLILNIVMFFVGITTTKDCPIKPIIPVYLAVAGALGVITKIIPIANRNRRLVIVDRILYALFIVEFIWMILGSVWIYSIYQPNYVPGREPHCNKTAYLLAFWLLTINYIFLLLVITLPCIILCCFCCCAALVAKAE